MTETTHHVFQLGMCRVDASDNSLSFAATASEPVQRVTLQPKFIEVLTYLAERYPRVVTREELITDIWEGNGYVGEKALTNAIWHLRQHLGKLSDEEAIETVRKTGYRLCIEPQFERVAEDPTEDLEQKVRNLGRGVSILLLSLALLVALIAHHWYTDSQHRPFGIERLTADGGSERFPAVSPDGRFLVYGGQQPGKKGSLFQLELHNPSASPKQLTSSETDELRAVWSLDGTALYFPSQTGKGCSIMRLTLKDGHLQPLTECSSATASIDLSPDGKTLAYIGEGPEDASTGIMFLDLTQEDAKPQRQSCDSDCAYRDRDFSFSPDGRYLAIARRFGDISEDIFLRSLSDGTERRLTQGIEDIRGLSWHDDGRRLVFSTEEAGNRDGFVLDTDTGEITPLHVDGLSYPRFIPDSDELVFYHYNNHRQMVTVPPFAEVAQAPFPMIYGNFSQRYVDYSAAANRLVFVSNESGYNEIWTSAPDGSRRQMHTELKRQAASPAWSHDGTRIAFVAADTNHEGNKLHVLDTRDNSIRVLASPYINHGRPEWSGDDSFLMASTLDGLTRFNFNNAEPAVFSPVQVRRMQVEGEWLYFTYADGPRGLWRMPWDKPAEPQQLLSSRQLTDGYVWTVTEDGVFYRAPNSASTLLSFYDFNSGESRAIINLPPNSISRQESMAWIPGSRELIMVSWSYPRRDVMLLRHPALQ
ncbi:PD40 domain-containing protein [Shewanella sp. JM162201]|uniref:PD40 domain-containing protein n=1 Tax=Shewanella jiangmenensis TaxID=2837387 RepID=A0ABS5V1X8_9GAMM|nr:winged helix-turn-helix domain-containing protein [Shewanella jiangmenensis]MBT1444472.1 PD40 domain-containing protein [Shewanella jiangmenensis]